MRGRDWVFTSVTAAAILALFGCDSMLPIGAEAGPGARPARAADTTRSSTDPDSRTTISTRRNDDRPTSTAARPSARSDDLPATTPSREPDRTTPEATSRRTGTTAAPVVADAAPDDVVATARTDADAPAPASADLRTAEAETREVEPDATVAESGTPVGSEAEAPPGAVEEQEAESGGSGWAWLLGIVLMGGVAFGAWLLLQPPWKRWRWYWSLRAGARKQWLKYFGGGEAKAPKRDSVRVGAPGAAAERPTIPESQIRTMVGKPAEEASPEPAPGKPAKPADKKPSKKYGTPLKSRDTTTVRTKRTKAQVVDDKGKSKSAKRKKRQTGITLPVIPLSKKNSKNN